MTNSIQNYDDINSVLHCSPLRRVIRCCEPSLILATSAEKRLRYYVLLMQTNKMLFSGGFGFKKGDFFLFNMNII